MTTIVFDKINNCIYSDTQVSELGLKNKRFDKKKVFKVGACYIAGAGAVVVIDHAVACFNDYTIVTPLSVGVSLSGGREGVPDDNLVRDSLSTRVFSCSKTENGSYKVLLWTFEAKRSGVSRSDGCIDYIVTARKANISYKKYVTLGSGGRWVRGSIFKGGTAFSGIERARLMDAGTGGDIVKTCVVTGKEDRFGI